MNPIEKAWDWCRHWLQQHHVVANNRKELESQWRAAWNALPQSLIDGWFKKMGETLQKFCERSHQISFCKLIRTVVECWGEDTARRLRLDTCSDYMLGHIVKVAPQVGMAEADHLLGRVSLRRLRQNKPGQASYRAITAGDWQQPTGQQKRHCIKDILAFGTAESKLVQAAMVEAWSVLTKDRVWQVR